MEHVYRFFAEGNSIFCGCMCNILQADFERLVISIFINRYKKEKDNVRPNLKEELKYEKPNYIKPKLKELSEEEIEEIHSKGLITPAEKVKEWEDLDLCAPGDAIGSAGWRCKKFHHNCHDCLVDYANGNDEYVSFYDELKIVNKK